VITVPSTGDIIKSANFLSSADDTKFTFTDSVFELNFSCPWTFPAIFLLSVFSPARIPVLESH